MITKVSLDLQRFLNAIYNDIPTELFPSHDPYEPEFITTLITRHNGEENRRIIARGSFARLSELCNSIDAVGGI